MMAKTKTTPRAPVPTQVTTAAKRPDKIKKFLADISAALDIFEDEISSLGDCRATAYKTFILSYRSAFAHIWPKIKAADVKIVLQSIKDKELNELCHMSQIMSSDSSKPVLIKENHAVPTLMRRTALRLRLTRKTMRDYSSLASWRRHWEVTVTSKLRWPALCRLKRNKKGDVSSVSLQITS